MNIIEELPKELLAIVLEYELPIEENRLACMTEVLNGPYRYLIVRAHTTIKETTDEYGVKHIEHLFEGKHHREPNQGPAYESYYPNGNIRFRQWYLNGKLYREPNEGCASEEYDKYGNIRTRQWYLNGKRHREPKEGPASEEYDKYGNILR